MADTDVAPIAEGPPSPHLPAWRERSPVVEHPFEFRGTTREYFRIWIVNLALTVVTLGVFSAWAKVRRERYFYGNTWVAGVPFQYLAPPLKILRGRVVAAAVFGSYVLLSQLSPLASLALIGALLLATPFLVVSALRFRARYSSWSTITFQFVGATRDAVTYYIVLSLLLIPTLGLSLPYQRFKQRAFMVSGHRFAGLPLTFGASASDYYAIYFIAGIGLALIGMLAFGVSFVGSASLPDIPAEYSTYAVFAPVGVLYGSMFFVWCYLASRTTNLTYDSTAFAENRFQSTVRGRDLLRIYLGNTVAILLSLGMLVPWAQIRLARYRAEHLQLIAGGDLGAFVDAVRTDVGATGAETANVFDLDLSI